MDFPNRKNEIFHRVFAVAISVSMLLMQSSPNRIWVEHNIGVSIPEFSVAHNTNRKAAIGPIGPSSAATSKSGAIACLSSYLVLACSSR